MTDTEATASPEALAEEEKTEAPSEETQEEEETSEEEESTEESAEEAETEDAAEEEPPKRRSSAKKRISELTRARHNAERERDTLQQQLEALQATVTPAAAPKQEDFQSIEEFDAARIKFHSAQAVREELKTLGSNVQHQQQQAAQDMIDADWKVQVEEARDKYDDFDDVVLDPGNTYFTPAMHRALAADENGADVAYHIASHPKLVREISALDDTGAVLRIGKLSARLGGVPASKQTKAPNPVKTVKSGSSSAKLTPYNAKNIDDYIKAREAQEKAGQT